jgi:hypothetical protein
MGKRILVGYVDEGLSILEIEGRKSDKAFTPTQRSSI